MAKFVQRGKQGMTETMIFVSARAQHSSTPPTFHLLEHNSRHQDVSHTMGNYLSR